VRIRSRGVVKLNWFVLFSIFLIGTLFSFIGCNQVEEMEKSDSVGLLTFEVSEEGYNILHLPESIYRGSKNDFSDIRIKSSDGDIVPWYLEDGVQYVEHKSRTKIQFQNVNRRLVEYSESGAVVRECSDDVGLFRGYMRLDKGNRIEMDYEFQLLGDLKVLKAYDYLELTFGGSNWSFRADLYGRNAKGEWKFITTDSLYSLDTYKKSQFNIGRGVKYQFLRLVLRDRENYPLLSIMQAVSNVSGWDYENHRLHKLDFKVSTENIVQDESDSGSFSSVLIENPNFLKIYQIKLITKGNFNRTIKLLDDNGKYIQSASIYSFSHNGDVYARTTIRLRNFSIGRRNSHFTIKIDNGNNKPIKIVGVEALCFFDSIVLGPVEKGEYSIEWGDPNSKRLDFDIKSFASRLDSEKLPIATVDKVSFYDESGEDESVMNIVIIQILFILAIVLIISAVGAVAAVQIKRSK